MTDMRGTLTAVRLTARRELVERTRERTFLISTLITVTILAAVIVLPHLFSKAPAYRIGLVGGGSERLGQAIAAQAPRAGVKVRLEHPGDAAAATAAVRHGKLTVALVDGRELVVKSSVPDKLQGVIQTASAALHAEDTLAQAGVSQPQIRAALAPAPLPVNALQPTSRKNQARKGIAVATVVVLYGQLIGYGIAVASGIVEEKATRVVEVLLATVRPVQLLAGKIIGIGLVGLLQLTIVGVAGLAVAVGGRIIVLPPGAGGTIAMAALWFVLGYAFYACLFAVAGALVSRQEELQNTAAPLNLVLVASFFLAFQALGSPDSPLARIASLLPPVAPLVMPPRVAGGEVAAWEVALSVAVTLAAVAALVPLAARMYSGAILRTGARVKLRDAWTAAGRSGTASRAG